MDVSLRSSASVCPRGVQNGGAGAPPTVCPQDDKLQARPATPRLPPRTTTVCRPRPADRGDFTAPLHVYAHLQEYGQCCKVFESWTRSVAEQLDDLSQAVRLARGIHGTPFSSYYTPEDLQKFCARHGQSPRASKMLGYLRILKSDCDELRRVLAQLAGNQVELEAVRQTHSVPAACTYLNDCYSHLLAFQARYAGTLFNESRLASTPLNVAAVQFKPLIVERQLDLCTPFASPQMLARRVALPLNGERFVLEEIGTYDANASAPEKMARRPRKTLRHRVQDSGAQFLAELSLNAAPAKTWPAVRAPVAAACLSETSESDEDDLYGDTADMTSMPLAATPSKPRKPSRASRLRKQPRPDDTPAGAASRTGLCAAAPSLPPVSLPRALCATLAKLLDTHYAEPVGVRDYLKLLEAFVRINTASGYLRCVKQMKKAQSRNHALFLTLGTGEALYFERADGRRVWMSFHYPHDHDGHNHNKVPKEYRRAYAKVFTEFEIDPDALG